MKVLRRIITILVGLGAIGLAFLPVYYKIDFDYEYVSNLPSWISWGNEAIKYALFGATAIVILLLMFGRKKAARWSLLPLLIVVGHYAYRYRADFLDIYNNYLQTSVISNIIDNIKNTGLGTTLSYLSMILVGLFFLAYLISAAVGSTHQLGTRIILFILGAGPLVVMYVATILGTNSYLPAYDDIVLFGGLYGIYFFIGFAVLVAHFNPNRIRRHKERTEGIDNPVLPIKYLVKK